MTSILSERPLTDAERAAIADEPRPGVWGQDVITVEIGPSTYSDPRALDGTGDGRPLSQHETDQLIGCEMSRMLSRDVPQWSQFVGIVGRAYVTQVKLGTVLALQQRGGVHSDPLVRLLAFRAWGDRDRAWRKRDTARVLIARPMGGEYEEIARRVYGWDGVADWHPEYTAYLGDRQVTAQLDASRGGLEPWLDLFDELDAKLAAGGEPLPSGPLTFEISSSPT